MTDANEVLSQVRDFVYSASPDEDARWAIYETLRDNMALEKLWRPMLRDHPRWRDEPLVWSHIDGMDGGALYVHGPNTTSMDDYAKVFPKGPLKLFIKGGDNFYDCTPEAPSKALMKRCVHIQIDNPEWSMDDGQNGGGEGSADLLEIVRAVWSCLKGTMRSVHTFELIAAPHQRWRSWGSDYDSTHEPTVQTNLLPPDFAKMDRGFKTLKSLVGRRKLKRFRLTNRAPLSKAHWSTGKIKPYCGWLAKCAWWVELTHLDLSDNGLDYRDMAWLFPLHMPQLTRLSLADNNAVDDEALRDLVREGFFPSLTHLDLRGTRITEEAVEEIKGSSLLPSLQVCSLDPA